MMGSKNHPTDRWRASDREAKARMKADDSQDTRCTSDAVALAEEMRRLDAKLRHDLGQGYPRYE